ncbi:MAG: ribonuclease Y [Candidatus Pacebacteria bacterium]|nr:ribonuclease Y [Candidatus Paceibacterota bacterium]
MIPTLITVGILLAILGFAGGYALKLYIDRQAVRNAEDITANARREAETITKEAKISAKEEILTAKEQFETSTQKRREELQKLEQRLDNRETNIERKADLLESRNREIDSKEKEVRALQEENRKRAEKLKELIGQEVTELERIGSMSREDARQQLMTRLSGELESERGALIRRFHEETEKRLERESQEIMITAMQRYAGDCAYERTTATIPLPNDEMKGRIIGREGRNIRTIEAATGVNLLIDDTPEAVVISCFDPIRKEIARVTLERLVADGRIHPTRIEEMVAKVEKEIDDDLLKTGQEAIDELGLTSMKQNIVRLLGRLKYRYSYSQNVLQHSKECAYLMGSIAAQIGLDEQKARKAGLLHDIGKAVDHEMEGTHASIGADLLKRNGEEDDIVNAVAAHHEEEEMGSLMAVLVNICDTLSASRPGARSETTELYLKRIEQLETIGKEAEGVENCYAIQAGRELRVIVEPENIDENTAALVAREIAGRIEKEMRYPGQVKVTVVRETRAVEYAK